MFVNQALDRHYKATKDVNQKTEGIKTKVTGSFTLQLPHLVCAKIRKFDRSHKMAYSLI